MKGIKDIFMDWTKNSSNYQTQSIDDQVIFLGVGCPYVISLSVYFWIKDSSLKREFIIYIKWLISIFSFFLLFKFSFHT